jgi:hypothetical protein
LKVRAAWALGMALPLLEMARRRTNFHPVASYIDNFIGGALLLWAARAMERKLFYGRSLLCASWGVVCGGLYYSFFGQIENSAAIDVSGLANLYVVAIKGGLFAIALVALILSVRHSSARTI